MKKINLFMKKTTLLLSVVALTLTQTGCGKDFLETKSTTEMPAAVLLSSYDGLLMALNGVHRQVAGLSTSMQTSSNMWPGQDGSQGYGGLYSHGIVIDHLGEDLIIRKDGNSWYRGAASWSDHRSESNGNPLRTYHYFNSIIGQMNMILAHVDEVVQITEDQKRMIKGQALAFRGFSYWWLVQLWGERYDATKSSNDQLGVPLVLEPIEKPQARASVQQVYNQINEDLDEAIRLLTNNPVAEALPNGHIKAKIAHGMKARVALTQANWPVAAHHAKTARELHNRMGTAAQLLDGMWEHTHPEFMWAYHQPADQGPVQASFSGYMSINYAGTFIRTSMRGISETLYESMDPTDIRRDWWVADSTDPVYNSIKAPANQGGNATIIFKYDVRKWRMMGVWTVPNTSNSVDPCFMRVSEMYLIEAEAEFMRGDENAARAALTTLMAVRVPGFTTTNTGEALLQEIWRNRRIELWGEGHRFLDLKRQNRGLHRTTEMVTTRGDIARFLNFIQWGSTRDNLIPANDIRWQWRIPRREILSSHGLVVQND
jgi:hypothetical protein